MPSILPKAIRTKTILSCAVSCAALVISAPAQAACADLLDLEIEDGKVTSAKVVNAGGFEQPRVAGGPPPGVGGGEYDDMPSFCRVEFTLTPSSDSDIKSEVWLPIEGWNGKYVGIGNGIWAGQISYSQMAQPIERGYATASTDTGHSGSGLTAEWGMGHPEKLVDFGYRAVHVTTLAAKAAVEAFYGEAPSTSLWNSCSTGGRQGVMAAYRYPQDFDAISAMAPANPMTDLMTQSMWAGWQGQRFDVALTPQVFGLVHSAAVKQCDALDGVSDGIIGRPQQCDFTPSSLQCAAGQSGGCLSTGQVNAISHLYSGVHDESGAKILPGFPIGSEMQLMILAMGEKPFPVATSYFEQILYGDNASWNWLEMEYGAEMAAARAHSGDMFNVPSDGLNPFFARGGKLLLSHGWNDGLIPAGNSLKFHRELYPSIPQSAAQNQLRLFMAPGMDHCGGGEGPSQIDTLAIIDDWATSGQAPNRIIATRPTSVPSFPGQPPAPDREPMERPLCAFPWVASYNGSGDQNVASSYSCALPETAS